jgi:hypothetical protein
MFGRDNETGSIRQAKGVGIVPNVSPHELIAATLPTSSTRSMTNMRSKSSKKAKERRDARRVIKYINDHSAIVHMKFEFPNPLSDRDSLTMYIWKEMEPGVILWLNRSVEHEAVPADSRYVRLKVKFCTSTARAKRAPK